MLLPGIPEDAQIDLVRRAPRADTPNMLKAHPHPLTARLPEAGAGFPAWTFGATPWGRLDCSPNIVSAGTRQLKVRPINNFVFGETLTGTRPIPVIRAQARPMLGDGAQ